MLSVAVFVCSVSIALSEEPPPTKWNIDGVEREALVYPPLNIFQTSAPVIFAFHGHGSDMHLAARGMSFQSFWPEAIIVYPQGLLTPGIGMDRRGVLSGWQREAGHQGDRDLKFVDAILATLREKYRVDETRIYATGFSNGGLFTYLLMSQRPNVFAAFAPGGAALLPSVPLKEPKPLLHYAGHKGRIARCAKQEATIETIRKFNGCAEMWQPCGADCTLYYSAKGAPVETFIHPFGHIYPRQVTPLIVKFFQDNPRRS